MKHKTVQLTRLVVAGLLFMGLCSGLFAQNRGISIKGTVMDNDGLPVIGASVLVKGTTTGAAADIDGKFSFTVPGESTVLEVSAIGYITQEVKVGKQRDLTIVLLEDSESIEATVVVAYGTQTKATVTGALTTIDSKALVKAPVADVTNVLAGQMPGVTTVQLSGQPGEDYAEIYIRGVSSLSDGASTPLILVDGVERSPMRVPVDGRHADDDLRKTCVRAEDSRAREHNLCSDMRAFVTLHGTADDHDVIGHAVVLDLSRRHEVRHARDQTACGNGLLKRARTRQHRIAPCGAIGDTHALMNDVAVSLLYDGVIHEATVVCVEEPEELESKLFRGKSLAVCDWNRLAHDFDDSVNERVVAGNDAVVTQDLEDALLALLREHGACLDHVVAVHRGRKRGEGDDERIAVKLPTMQLRGLRNFELELNAAHVKELVLHEGRD